MASISAKLVRRHPHVFGDAQASDPDEVWQSGTKSSSRSVRREPANTLWSRDRGTHDGGGRQTAEYRPAANCVPATLATNVTLKGWVNRRRDHGGLIFLDIRDRYGLTQVVANPEHSPAAHAVAEGIRAEYVVEARGMVRPRPEGTSNRTLATGEIEIEWTNSIVLNPAKPLPFELG